MYASQACLNHLSLPVKVLMKAQALETKQHRPTIQSQPVKGHILFLYSQPSEYELVIGHQYPGLLLS
jgi:hypothetical protein